MPTDVDTAMAAVAARVDDSFRLPARHAPGLHLFGALARPAAFGLHGFEAERISAGGRGLTAAAAFASGIGELAERLSAREADDDPLLHAAPADADGGIDRHWIAGGLGVEAAADGIPGAHVRARPLAGGDAVRLPAELVLHRRPDRRMYGRRPGSTGVAAGQSLEAATLAALLEVIERDAVALWWFGGEPASPLEPAALGWRRVTSLCTRIRHPASPRRFWFLLLTTDVPVPVVACCSSAADGDAVVAGFAAHPDPEAAAARAFLEMCQMEVAQELALMKAGHLPEAELPGEDRVWLERSRSLGVAAFPELRGRNDAVRDGPTPAWHGRPTTPEGIAQRLSAQGMPALAVDLFRQAIGVPVVRVLVPGLQSTRRDWITLRLERAAARNGVDLGRRLAAVAPI